MSSWEDQQKKKKPILLILVVLVLGSIVTLFIANNSDNSDILPKPTIIETDTIIDIDSATINYTSISEIGVSIKKSSSISNKTEKNNVITNLDTITTHSSHIVSIPKIACKLLGNAKSSIMIGITIYLKDKKNTDLIMQTREDIKIVVKKTFRRKDLSEIKIKVLRKELIDEINVLIGKEVVTDIEFTDFTPL